MAFIGEPGSDVSASRPYASTSVGRIKPTVSARWAFSRILDYMKLEDISDPAPSPSSADWNDEGVVILKNCLPDWLMNDYEQEWLADAPGVGGWRYATPYMEHPMLQRLVCNPLLAQELEDLLGEPAGVHLNLTGWRSTTRDWHQDTYLNPPHVGDSYAAVWIALADIHPDSGPFQYVPGSHRWPVVTQEHIGKHVDLTDPHWPTYSEDILTPVFTEEIASRGAEVVTYLPKRGDVLIWHGRLVHRGSNPINGDLERRALIAHYSGINHREDMPVAVQHEMGGYYFPLGGRQPTSPG